MRQMPSSDRHSPGSLGQDMIRVLALALTVLAFVASSAGATVQPLPAPLQAQLKGGFWHAGCPVPLAKLRLLTVKTWGFDGELHTGQLVVNASAAGPLQRVFAKLYAL